jgi:hypothetical protein
MVNSFDPILTLKGMKWKDRNTFKNKIKMI